MDTGYEDIEKLTTQKQAMIDEAMKQQENIVNQQTQMNVDALERNKQDIEKDAIKTNRALYQQYRKASNPFGIQAENLASQGLGNSGYAETTMSRLYNTYQQNVTSTLNNARDLKADVDFQINQARQTGNITLAQNQLELYKQKMQLLSDEYDLKNNREQFLYRKEQDALAQSNWQTEFDYQKAQNERNYNYQVARDRISDNQWQQNFDYNKYINDRNYNYQVARDKVSDSQWQKEYELAKKAKASSSRSSGSTSKKGNDGLVATDDTKLSTDAQKVLGGLQDILTGVAKTGATAMAVSNGIRSGNISGTLKVLKNTASNALYSAYKNGSVTEEEAEAISKKLGL